LPTENQIVIVKMLSDFFCFKHWDCFFNNLSLNYHKQVLRPHILDLYLYNN